MNARLASHPSRSPPSPGRALDDVVGRALRRARAPRGAASTRPRVVIVDRDVPGRGDQTPAGARASTVSRFAARPRADRGSAPASSSRRRAGSPSASARCGATPTTTGAAPRWPSGPRQDARGCSTASKHPHQPLRRWAWNVVVTGWPACFRRRRWCSNRGAPRALPPPPTRSSAQRPAAPTSCFRGHRREAPPDHGMTALGWSRCSRSSA